MESLVQGNRSHKTASTTQCMGYRLAAAGIIRRRPLLRMPSNGFTVVAWKTPSKALNRRGRRSDSHDRDFRETAAGRQVRGFPKRGHLVAKAMARTATKCGMRTDTDPI